jgi:peptide/nickel transport system permease protein
VRTRFKSQEPKSEDYEQERYYVASHWELMWWKFKKHKMAILSCFVLVVLYSLAVLCEFLSPYNQYSRFPDYVYAPPHRIRVFARGEGFQRPFIYGLRKEINKDTYRRVFVIDKTKKYPVIFFAHGEPYRFWGIFNTDIHFLGSDGMPVFILGTDHLGRDLMSRTLYASRISLSIGFAGLFFTFIIGLILGGLSGYLGGVVDTFIQRAIDLLISIPTIPLWMSLAAVLPRDWSPIKAYFGIVIIFSAIGWTSLARVVRGKVLSLREEDFVTASRIAGSSNWWIIRRHLLPSFISYIIVSLTLAIPNMIMGETALSFIGLGIQPPAVSWGTLLQDAQNIHAIASYPWILTPAIFVIVSVFMFNFLGDGLRDSVDPLGVA